MAQGRKLSDEQIGMVIHAYKFFLAEKNEGYSRGKRTRSLVAQCLGVAASTVSAVWASHMKQEGASSAEESRGRPRSFNDGDAELAIRAYVNECNHQRQPITAKLVAEEVETRTSIRIGYRSMCRLLRRLGYKYIKGEKRHYLAESAANVAYRATYLQLRPV
ncbi:Winged helix-turn helix [Phytophthora infestans]|uniref:Winged helix-turn helix n=1 Tax=Phytophthora infestans TaxID=4787 RepID=A0A8S9TYQ1_PHYIN|nr:Winged helix-turn helix [Phytophthora infestans]